MDETRTGPPPDVPGYEIQSVLGAGGMGVVYLARNTLLDRTEVLKVIAKDVLRKAGVRDRFFREVRAAAALSHPNVVAAYAAVGTGETLALAMEYVPGRDLRTIVVEDGPLAAATAAEYVRQAALGLEHAHERGLVHRDVKPANLILAGDTVKILDFGLAKVTDTDAAAARLTHSGVLLGTPLYLAPEQSLDAAAADPRSDLYSLGCTLFFLLTGRPPFEATSLVTLLTQHLYETAPPLANVRPDVPAGLAAVTARLMAKDPAQRYPTAAAVADALAPFTGAAVPPDRPRRRFRVVLLAAIAAVAAAGIAAAVIARGPGTAAPNGAETAPPAVPPSAPPAPPVDIEPPFEVILRAGVPLLRVRELSDPAAARWAPADGAFTAPPGGDRLFHFPDLPLTDFKLIAEVKVTGGGGEVVVRGAARGDGVKGYAVALGGTDPRLAAAGAVFHWEYGSAETRPLSSGDPAAAPPPDTWFTLEVVAQGNVFTALCDGKPFARGTDPAGRFGRGWVGFAAPPSGAVAVRNLRLRTLAPGDIGPPTEFTPLFNGKDLTGWQTHPDQPGGWTVEDGVLVGRGPKIRHLYSEVDDYTDTHVRATFRINEFGNSGLFARVGFGPDQPANAPLYPTGYECEIGWNRIKKELTGAVHRSGPRPVGPPARSVLRPGEWVTAEMIVRGATVSTRLDGAPCATFTDPDPYPGPGRIALAVHAADTKVEFRSVEIKRLDKP